MKVKSYPFLFVFLLFTINAFSQKPVILTSDKPGWHRIGELTMKEEADTSSVEVIGADSFSAIRLKAEKGSVNIYEVNIYYEEGTPQCIPLEKVLKAGQQSRVISFRGGDRKLRRISLVGRKLPSEGDEKAEVRLTGFRPPERKK
jgi:hypothetical protein